MLRSVEGPVETWVWADDMSNGPPSTTGGAGGQSTAGCKYRVRVREGAVALRIFYPASVRVDFGSISPPNAEKAPPGLRDKNYKTKTKNITHSSTCVNT